MKLQMNIKIQNQCGNYILRWHHFRKYQKSNILGETWPFQINKKGANFTGRNFVPNKQTQFAKIRKFRLPSELNKTSQQLAGTQHNAIAGHLNQKIPRNRFNP